MLSLASLWGRLEGFRVYSCGYSSGIAPDSLLVLVSTMLTPEPFQAVKVGIIFSEAGFNRAINPAKPILPEFFRRIFCRLLFQGFSEEW